MRPFCSAGILDSTKPYRETTMFAPNLLCPVAFSHIRVLATLFDTASFLLWPLRP